MKLKEYLENFQKLVETNPAILDYEVVYGKDDEGNNFQKVNYEPSIGIFDEEDDMFISENQKGEWDREEEENNTICIN